MDRRSQLSPFPVPAICYYQPVHEQRFDVIVVSDFSTLDDTVSRDVAYLKRLRGVGLKVAILQWPCYDSAFKSGAGFGTARLCRQLNVVTLVHGEKARCDLVSICQPRAMMHKLDRVPDVMVKRVVIAAGEMPDTRGASDRAYEPEVVQENVSWAFGNSGEWIPEERFKFVMPAKTDARP